MEAVLSYMNASRKESIAARLTALGCAPFSRWSVFKYKRVAWVDFALEQVYLQMLMICTGVDLIAGAAFHTLSPLLKMAPPSVWAIVGGVFAGIFFAAVIIATFLILWMLISEHRPRWETVRGEHAVFLVPPNLEHRLTRTSAEFPDAIFEVDRLGGDPFLVARIKGCRYFIGVWDEKGFVK